MKNQIPKTKVHADITISLSSHDHLNEAQRKAVLHKEGPALVIAGAGTGKTRVITERIAYLIHSGAAKSDQILGLTFTEKAAAEMQERLDVLMPLGYSEVDLKTFHAFADEVLRQYGIDIGIPSNYKILSGVEQWQFMKENLFSFELEYYRPMGNPTRFIDSLLSYFGKLKEEMVSPQHYLEYALSVKEDSKEDADQHESAKHLELAKAYGQYQEMMMESNFLDFADLQYKLLDLFQKRPNILKALQSRFQYILVDEYQDTNVAQNKIVDLLSAAHRNLMVVGDDDQSIYKFRGAAISNILKFQDHYSDLTKIVLNQNYRSNQRILDLAYASIQHNNPDRLEVKAGITKKLIGQTKGLDESIRQVHCSTVEQEVEYVIGEISKSGLPLSEIAVLCRANSYALPFIEAFKRANIPYQFPSEKGLYDKKEIKDLIALLRALANPRDDISFYRILRMPFWKFRMESIAELIQKSKKTYSSIWSHIKQNAEFKLFADIYADLLEFSKTHTVGEVLYRFTEAIQLYPLLLRASSVEAEAQVVSIASFFEKLRQFERSYPEHSVIDFVSYLDLAEEAGDNPAAQLQQESNDAVQISTIHASKGLEFDTVFVIGLTRDRFPSRRRKDPIEMPKELIQEILSEDDVHLQEERRLFYVAVTRAKETLHLSYSDFYNPSTALKPRSKKPSPFLAELEGKAALLQLEKTTEGIEQFLRPTPVMSVDLSSRPTADKITSFSYSQISTFERCPRQYQYQYLLKIPSPPAANLSFGSSMHNTLQDYYTIARQAKQASLFTEYDPDLSLEKLLSIYEDKWIDQGYESAQHMNLRKERGKEILKLFYDRFKDDIPQVQYLEKGFRLKIGDYTISGRIDRADKLTDGTLHIIDYKTGRSRDEKAVREDLQLALYALASKECFGIPASLLTLHFLDANETVSVAPTNETIEKAKQKVLEVGGQINQSTFTPKASKQTCGFCPYRKICDAAV